MIRLWHRRALELVDRVRIDDRRIRVTLEVLGDVRAGDVLVATLEKEPSIEVLKAVRAELKRWVRHHAPGAEVLVQGAGVNLGHVAAAEARQTLECIEVLLADLEGHVERWEAGVASRPGTADVREYAQTLAHGITAIRYVMGGPAGWEPPAPAPASSLPRPRSTSFVAPEDRAA